MPDVTLDGQGVAGRQVFFTKEGREAVFMSASTRYESGVVKHARCEERRCAWTGLIAASDSRLHRFVGYDGRGWPVLYGDADELEWVYIADTELHISSVDDLLGAGFEAGVPVGIAGTPQACLITLHGAGELGTRVVGDMALGELRKVKVPVGWHFVRLAGAKVIGIVNDGLVWGEAPCGP